jgi:hypothetical protein
LAGDISKLSTLSKVEIIATFISMEEIITGFNISNPVQKFLGGLFSMAILRSYIMPDTFCPAVLNTSTIVELGLICNL